MNEIARQLIQERDVAAESFSQVYYLVTGQSPGWSQKFGYEQAIADVANALRLLKAEIKHWQMNCPHCKKPISDKTIARHLASKAGKKGRGAAKARDPEKMRQAALKRWATSKSSIHHSRT